MKKLFFALIALIISVSTALAGDKVIDQSSLPKNAQKFISTHYPKTKVSVVTMDKDMLSKDYTVVFVTGVKVEFDEKGNWTEIECDRRSSVPSAVVPTEIAKYVKKKFPSNSIMKIEKDKKSYEIELNNGRDLEFNSKGEFLR